MCGWRNFLNEGNAGTFQEKTDEEKQFFNDQVDIFEQTPEVLYDSDKRIDDLSLLEGSNVWGTVLWKNPLNPGHAVELLDWYTVTMDCQLAHVHMHENIRELSCFFDAQKSQRICARLLTALVMEFMGGGSAQTTAHC